MYASLCNHSWVASIIDGIREQVSNATLRRGDRLPSEGELADQFGGSRFAVREAVKFLINWQVLELRAGEGIFVRSRMDRVDSFRTRNRIAIRDHLEAQYLLEAETARLAARRRTLEDIRRLWRTLALRGEYSISDELDDFVDRDQALHGAVAVASHNVVLQSMYRSFSSSFHSQYLAIFADNELYEPGLEAHARVVQAIIYGDEDAAVAAVRAMFDPMLEKLSWLSERDGSVL
ncbi:FadR family transcriptional regulator [Pseudomonas yamanorum]|jgi:DNA-binding FadR family transcriptional regulator|uniref:FadR/GntR family transcriptional regulator n=1 Tax=Pseudomonas TaxID=286 RepID=UPI0015A4BA2F|nr:MULTISPECIES: FCD domain-containing protein [Pseudomonas]NWC30201.1 FadR family transcriptional regulator [Pseudomonas tolaasii]NWD24166.1 FadR family transcriptional regulator [Pseudomonas yamanorum]